MNVNITIKGVKAFIEPLARLSVLFGTPVDEICAAHNLGWSAHERLELHQKSQEMKAALAALKSQSDDVDMIGRIDR